MTSEFEQDLRKQVSEYDQHFVSHHMHVHLLNVTSYAFRKRSFLFGKKSK